LRYIGIDLAWKVAPPRHEGTGICIIEGDGEVSCALSLTTDQDVLAQIKGGDMWVGVDAPLRVPPGKAIRVCERDLRSMGMRILPSGREFHQRHYGGSRGEELASELRGMGLEYFGTGRRAFFEVYPHAVLRSLPPPPPQYKKGPQAVRQEEAERALTLLSRWEPTLHWTPTMRKVLSRGKGAADRLDALLAAVSLYRHSLYSGELSLVLGDDDDGFLLLPRGWEDGRRM